ncbi:hypothetical protein ACA910_011303 [Epithemia clementina (nom. ined.)]
MGEKYGFVPDQIRLLVCTANLGNAQPDNESLDAWIPRDGFCCKVIQPNPTYPLILSMESEAGRLDGSSGLTLEQIQEDEDDSSISTSDDSRAPGESFSSPSVERQPATKGDGLTLEKRRKLAHSLAAWARVLTAKVSAPDPSILSTEIEGKSAERNGKQDNLTVDETDQFDLIVVGMQEATFDQPSFPSTHGLGQAVESGGSNLQRESGGAFRSPIVQPFHKGAQLVRKEVGKGVQAIAHLTQDRDYTKQNYSKYLATQRRDWGGGTALLHAMLDAQLPSYDRIVSYQRGQMRLEIYCNSTAVNVEVVHVSACNTGRAGLANKGGIAAELLVNGSTRISFLTAHLEAHEGESKFKTRCSSLAEILSGTKSSKWLDVSQTSHFAFALGDLNFRTVLDTSLPKDAHRRAIQGMVEKENWHGLNKTDELHTALREKSCLVGFKTPICNFPPTFKTFAKPGFEYQEKRRPSYCDRILWKAAPDLDCNISPIVYEPVPNFSTSDHKPIRGAFTIDMNRPFRASSSRNKGETTARRIRKSLRFGANSGLGTDVHVREEEQAERVEFFLSNISVDIFNKEGIAPNPYVSLLSYPETALQTKTRKWRPRLLRRDPKGKRRVQGWPSTSRKFSSFSPTWVDEEEIQCKIYLHHPDGTPVDLTGAMLHLAVIDYHPALEDSLIGAVSFNLTSILSKCRDQAESITQRQHGHDASPQASRFRGARKSLMAVLSMSKRPQEGNDSFGTFPPAVMPASSAEDPITTTEIDEVLVKNGREVGRIKCTLETWWVNSITAQILGSKPMQSVKPRTLRIAELTTGRTRSSQASRRSSFVPRRH